MKSGGLGDDKRKSGRERESKRECEVSARVSEKVNGRVIVGVSAEVNGGARVGMNASAKVS
jgi:hypothetical protein